MAVDRICASPDTREYTRKAGSSRLRALGTKTTRVCTSLQWLNLNPQLSQLAKHSTYVRRRLLPAST
jgi:hypothetical protein